MGNMSYWYLLSLQHFLEANSLKEALLNGYFIWILQIGHNILWQNAQYLCNHSYHTSCSSLSLLELSLSLLWYELCLTEHTTLKNPAGNYRHRTHIPAFQLARPTPGCPDTKQAATQRNNVLFHWMGFTTTSVRGGLLALPEDVSCVCFTVITQIFPSAFCFSTGVNKQHLTTVTREHIITSSANTIKTEEN